MVSFWVVAAVAVFAFVIGVLAARRRSNEKMIWEPPRTSAAHDAAIAYAQLRTLLEQKQLIATITRYRQLTGCGLEDEKDAVEALQRSLPGE